MAMTAKQWSINGIATELGVDRRTLARRLHDADPAGYGSGGSPLFWMRDAFRRLIRPAGMQWSAADADDAQLTGFVRALEEDDGLAQFVRGIAGDDAPRLLRRIRECLATNLWDFIRTPSTDPQPPDWTALSDADFDAAYDELVLHGNTLSEIADFVARRAAKA